jgi:hypothetical protein
MEKEFKMENEKACSMKTGDDDRDFLYNDFIARAATGLKTGFYYHLAVYLTVNLLMLVISLYLTPGFFWVMYMAMGWGIGIILHGLSALVFGLATGPKRT